MIVAERCFRGVKYSCYFGGGTGLSIEFNGAEKSEISLKMSQQGFVEKSVGTDHCATSLNLARICLEDSV